MNDIYLIRLILLKRPGFQSQKYGMPNIIVFFISVSTSLGTKKGAFMAKGAIDVWGAVAPNSPPGSTHMSDVDSNRPFTFPWGSSRLTVSFRGISQLGSAFIFLR